MVGRNEPCTCGSGKKYKTCCLNKQNVISLESHLKEELLMVLGRFFQTHPTGFEIKDLEKWVSNQNKKMSTYYGQETTTSILGDAYFFKYNQEIWLQHIEIEMKKTSRPRVKQILEQWKIPKTLLAQVVDITDKKVMLNNLLVDEQIEIENDESFTAHVDDYVFGHFIKGVMPTNASYMFLNNVLVLKSVDKKLVEKVKFLYKEANSSSEQAFYDNHLMTCYELLGNKSLSSDFTFNEEEEELIQALHISLVDMDEKSNELMMLFLTFLHEKGIPKNMKKPLALVMGAIQLGMFYNWIHCQWTKKDLAAYFEVSASTANKYEGLLEAFYVEELGEVDLNPGRPVFAIERGTDPNSTELANWEMLMHLQSVENTSEKDLHHWIEKFKNKRYEPKNPQEEAQKYAYEAYTTTDFDKLRINSAKLAYLLDKNNVDALLLKAEMENLAENYEQAIKIGEKQLDTSFDIAWGYVPNRPYLRALMKYGVWHFENQQYIQALKYFTKLLEINPVDNQGVRYIAITTYILLSEYKKAATILKKYQDEEDAILLWLEWVLTVESNGNELSIEKAYKKALEGNSYFLKYINKDISPLPYPKHLLTTANSPEEAKFIWILIAPIIR